MPLVQAQASSRAGKAMASNGAPLRYAVDAARETPNGPPTAGGEAPKGPRPAGERRRLDSWKGIAAYLGRGVRTVQRWEREEGLPVHRLAHDKGGNVYARRGGVGAAREEVAAWWEGRRRTLTAQPQEQPHADAKPDVPRLERLTLTSGMTAWPA